jgi:hypothetical protein
MKYQMAFNIPSILKSELNFQLMMIVRDGQRIPEIVENQKRL